MSEVAGNPVSALILQVVAYHNLTLVQSDLNEKNYKAIRAHWEAGGTDIQTKMPAKTLICCNFRYNWHRQRDSKALS